MMATDFYQKLFSRDASVRECINVPNFFPRQTKEELQHIQWPVTDIEIKQAVYDMGAFKAPGPDGRNASLLQNHWVRLIYM